MSIQTKPFLVKQQNIDRGAALGRTIQEEREFQNLTREQLAEYLGCNVLVMQLIEEGFWIPSDPEISLLARALDCPEKRFAMLVEFARAEEALLRVRYQ
jgi:transcriptional regulator with XRE-family HTH domain